MLAVGLTAGPQCLCCLGLGSGGVEEVDVAPEAQAAHSCCAKGTQTIEGPALSPGGKRTSSSSCCCNIERDLLWPACGEQEFAIVGSNLMDGTDAPTVSLLHSSPQSSETALSSEVQRLPGPSSTGIHSFIPFTRLLI